MVSEKHVIKIYDLELSKNISVLQEAEHIVIYGAGSKGIEVFNFLDSANINVDCFCDSDPQKCTESIDRIMLGKQEKVPILSPNQIIQYQSSFCIIACIEHSEDALFLFQNLLQTYNGDKTFIKFISYWGIKHAMFIHKKDLFKKNTDMICLLEEEEKYMYKQTEYLGFRFLKNYVNASSDSIYIYQPGKVGSSTIKYILDSNKIPNIHEHTMKYPNHVLGESLRAVWENTIQLFKNRKMKIITGVREPLARDYSAFWASYSRIAKGVLGPVSGGNVQRMYEIFTDLILKGVQYTREQLGVYTSWVWEEEFNWFDEQILECLGIDIYKYPFDKEKGYGVIRENDIEIFLYKLEKLNVILPELEQFVGKDLHLDNKTDVNLASDKWYSLAYKEFKKEVRLPKTYVDHYYKGNPKVKHFYSLEELNKSVKKWNIDIAL